MHIIHLGVVVTAPDYLTPTHARDVLAETLAHAKGTAQDRLKLGAIDDLAVMLNNSDFLVTEESPAKRRLDWLIANQDCMLTGSDRTGWIVWRQDTEYTAGPTAYAAIDAALAKESK